MSSLALGLNQIEIERGLTTSSTAIFVPFFKAFGTRFEGRLYKNTLTPRNGCKLRTNQRTGGMQIEKTSITKELMRINTRRQIIDIQQIDNRRFMYNPKTGILVLGYQYAATSTMVSSHANELADAGITKGYDDFVRGWIGTGGDYPKGVIHFAPCVDKRSQRHCKGGFQDESRVYEP